MDEIIKIREGLQEYATRVLHLGNRYSSIDNSKALQLTKEMFGMWLEINKVIDRLDRLADERNNETLKEGCDKIDKEKSQLNIF